MGMLCVYMGSQDELFQIGREHCPRSLHQQITQNFLIWLDKGKCQKQIRQQLDIGAAMLRQK